MPLSPKPDAGLAADRARLRKEAADEAAAQAARDAEEKRARKLGLRGQAATASNGVTGFARTLGSGNKV